MDPTELSSEGRGVNPIPAFCSAFFEEQVGGIRTRASRRRTQSKELKKGSLIVIFHRDGVRHVCPERKAANATHPHAPPSPLTRTTKTKPNHQTTVNRLSLQRSPPCLA
jgi:hypothetical protein